MRGLVHELRNPLSAVLTASSLVQGGADADEETTMLLDVIQKEARRMNRILTEFSHFVKPPTPQIETFDLGALVCSKWRLRYKAMAPSRASKSAMRWDARFLVTGDPRKPKRRCGTFWKTRRMRCSTAVHCDLVGRLMTTRVAF